MSRAQAHLELELWKQAKEDKLSLGKLTCDMCCTDCRCWFLVPSTSKRQRS